MEFEDTGFEAFVVLEIGDEFMNVPRRSYEIAKPQFNFGFKFLCLFFLFKFLDLNFWVEMSG